MCPKKLRNLSTQLLCILWHLCIQCVLFHLKHGSQWQQAALQAYSNYSLICLARENSPAIKNYTIFLANSARKYYARKNCTCRVSKSKYGAGLSCIPCNSHYSRGLTQHDFYQTSQSCRKLVHSTECSRFY